MASMLLGALLVAGGLVQTTTSHSNTSCPSGSQLVAKFNYSQQVYSFDSPSGNSNVVTLTNTSGVGGNWASTLAVSAVIVRAGNAAVTTSIAPPQFSGTFSNAGLPTSDDDTTLPNNATVQFCGPTVQPSTSTSSSSTTSSSTTLPSTSTTKRCTCTSTTTTSTTLPPTTTTTEEATTTSTSTTTTSTTPTTEPRETTTSASSTTTSTTETTIPDGTTTSSTQVAGTTVVGGSTSTTVRGAGSTTTSLPYVTSTTVFTPDEGTLPFTGGQSGPLIVLGILFLATGFALTLSATRRQRGSRA